MKYDKDGLREERIKARKFGDARYAYGGAWAYEDKTGLIIVPGNYGASFIIPRRAILDYADRVRGIADSGE